MSKYFAQYFLEKGFRVACADSLADLKDGFWINDDLEFTKGSDCRYWIPVSVIKLIEKDTIRKMGH